MKILITTFTYPPLADGCSTAAEALACGLAKLGHSVIVATAFHPDRKLNLLEANPFVEQFKVSGKDNWRTGVQGETAAYQDFLRNFSGDLIIFETWDAWSTCLAKPLLKQIKAKKILVSHGYTPHLWDIQSKFPWGLGNWSGGWPLVLQTPWLMRQFDQVVVLSRWRDFGRFFDHWLAQATGFKKISIIPNGAFVHEFNNAKLPDFRKEFGLGAGLLFLCVANYSDRKNQRMAVRAFRRAKLADATFVLVGSELNDYSKAVQQLDEELQPSFPAGRVIFLEKLSRAQTCAAYKAADLFVLSAKAETQPIVLLEAMASHTPWLSTDTGCVSELPGGMVVQTEDEMVEKMKELAASPTLRQKLMEEGWSACQQTYDWERVIAAYDQLIQQTVAK